ncbi:hypothetical protein Val02_88520 [Virgisporangium aliadipatigenens]|uniref:Uncharacterized protein n=1 Tax=Virgisporangium aliadipatigenens TaxID=741659 RepID=A0A8J3YYD2_9ACTN|nr:hypothetical protein [Virgisporangium aliadipatigenens]GIJ51966.1 hypothetical protein Val02_88520 [Virgisporangium aliadipatigenens]
MSDGEATGHPRVDAAMAELERVASRPPADQIAGYTHVHRELHETLAELDEER